MGFLKKYWWVLVILAILVLGGIFILRESPKRSTETAVTAETPKQEVQETWVKNTDILFQDTTSTSTLALADGTYRMYLMSAGGISYTESQDGKTFGEKTSTGITQSSGKMISNPSVLEVSENDWIMVYEEQPEKKSPGGEANPPSAETQRNLYLATSSDGKSFQKVGIAIDSSLKDNFFASVPELVKLPDGKIRMYYVSGGEAIGSAVSSDRGRTWERENGYRLENSTVDPEVIYEEGVWVMYYSTLPKPEAKERNAIYKARSKDGLTWEPVGKVLEPDSEMGFVVDPDIVKINGKYRMFFGESTGDIGAPGAINLYFADRN